MKKKASEIKVGDWIRYLGRERKVEGREWDNGWIMLSVKGEDKPLVVPCAITLMT